jgi:DNA (cytosine-5)-methyltransferase 1
MTLNVLDLFSGIGGFSLGLERTGGFRTVAFCEIDHAAQKVLNHHWPAVPIYGNVRLLTKEDIKERVDVICGGFPCQDISQANASSQGIIGERSGLWSEFFRLIKEFKPKYAIIENVSALRNRGLALVLQNLAQIGYDAEWHCIPASAVGASHERDRIWLVAYPINKRPQGRLSGWPDAEWEGLYRRIGRNLSGPKARWVALPYEPVPCTEPPRTTPTEPRLGRASNGLPRRMDRIKQLGNAVVPQIPELLGEAILEFEREYEKAFTDCVTYGTGWMQQTPGGIRHIGRCTVSGTDECSLECQDVCSGEPSL